ncbi:MAG: hypothetical protein U0556_11930 [Dehalococcoidia bacterium]
MDLSHVLAADYRGKALEDVLDSPVTALAGATPEAAESLRAQFKIEPVEGLGKNVLFRFAAAMVVMGGVKNDALHSDWGDQPLRDALGQPPTTIKYITADQGSALATGLGITTLKEMGSHPLFQRAQALLALRDL